MQLFPTLIRGDWGYVIQLSLGYYMFSYVVTATIDFGSAVHFPKIGGETSFFIYNKFIDCFSYLVLNEL